MSGGNYTWFDRLVGSWRYAAAGEYVLSGCRLCDLGCGVDALFLRHLGGRAGYSVGIDHQAVDVRDVRADFVKADIQRGIPLEAASVDCVTMLAVLEHIEEPCELLADVYRVLASGGRLIMTWPGPAVDLLLPLLTSAGLVSPLTETHNHQPRLPVVYWQGVLAKVGFVKVYHRAFELGLNHLMVAYKGKV